MSDTSRILIFNKVVMLYMVHCYAVYNSNNMTIILIKFLTEA